MGALDGRVALITGAGTGIGRRTALLFAEEGAKVVVAARREAPLREVAGHAPDAIAPIRMDLTSREDRHRAVDFARERFGRLDILVNNAADQSHGPFLAMSEEAIAGVIDTNLVATMLLIHRAAPLLRETGGNVITLSSTAGRFAGMPAMLLSAYSASRGGLNHMTRVLATELGPLGIRINAVAPGLTHGEVSDRALAQLPPAALEGLRAACPLGRIGEPIDVARVLLFLAGDQAAWITGQVIDASGGFQLGGG